VIVVSPEQISADLVALFDPAMPASLRCFAVLDGSAAGRVLTDDVARPRWGAVRDAGSSTLYLGGDLSAGAIRDVIAALRADGDVLIGLWPDDERLALLPADPDYDGRTLDFADRDPAEDLAPLMRLVPPDCEIRRLDRDLLDACVDRDYYAAIYGGAERAIARGFGRCAVRAGEVVCEAFAGPAARGRVELSVTTRETDRGRGLATATCAHLINDCESAGLRPYWNCAKQNTASAALASTLGFAASKEYRLLAWFGSTAATR
jgi:hypothetical protein